MLAQSAPVTSHFFTCPSELRPSPCWAVIERLRGDSWRTREWTRLPQAAVELAEEQQFYQSTPRRTLRVLRGASWSAQECIAGSSLLAVDYNWVTTVMPTDLQQDAFRALDSASRFSSFGPSRVARATHIIPGGTHTQRLVLSGKVQAHALFALRSPKVRGSTGPREAVDSLTEPPKQRDMSVDIAASEPEQSNVHGSSMTRYSVTSISQTRHQNYSTIVSL